MTRVATESATVARLHLRPATAADAEMLFRWANSPDALAASLKTKGPIPWATHVAWLGARLNNEGAAISIAEVDGAPVGQVRLEQAGNFVDVSIYVDNNHRGKGFALQMLRGAASSCMARWPGASLRARIRSENVPSRRLFLTAGFVETASHEEHCEFMLPNKDDAKRTRVAKGFAKTHELYDRALRTIPLASQTFSKSAMQHVFGASPLFLDRGKGALAWDVDGNEYVDYILGLLPIVLGYRDPDVDAAIRNQLERGISFSLGTELEIELAELLVRLIPCAEMVRFAKNGSDVTSAAVRLARAATGRERIAACGYHGWHDWYIGTTTRHLGIPTAVRDLSVTFPFNDLAKAEDLFRAHPNEFAAVVLEPAGAAAPAPGFLEGLRALTAKYGALLIFDEIVTGFRIDLGGAQKAYGVTPDLACFGKAMGNGMPIGAVVGSRKIMRLMEDIFFSGTFGGEALSLAAAIATIAKLERENVVPRLHRVGSALIAALDALIAKHGLRNRFAVAGPNWWPRFVVREGLPPNVANSLLRQELVANGLLIGPTFNLCLAHDDEGILARTIDACDRALATLAEVLASPDPARFLRGTPIAPVFKVRG